MSNTPESDRSHYAEGKVVKKRNRIAKNCVQCLRRKLKVRRKKCGDGSNSKANTDGYSVTERSRVVETV